MVLARADWWLPWSPLRLRVRVEPHALRRESGSVECGGGGQGCQDPGEKSFLQDRPHSARVSALAAEGFARDNCGKWPPDVFHEKEDEKLEEAARPYIEEMLTTSPLGMRLTKECLNMSVDAGSLEAAVAMEDRNQILCAQTKDFREGISAFLEKRKPAYTNS